MFLEHETKKTEQRTVTSICPPGMEGDKIENYFLTHPMELKSM